MTEAPLDSLLQRAAADDRGAQDELVLRFCDRVRAIVHRELQGNFRAQHRWILPLFSTSDIVQEVLTQAIRGLRDTDFPGEGAFVRYLATIVRNHLISAVRFHESNRRDQRRHRAATPEEAGVTAPTVQGPDLAASIAERAEVVDRILASFSARHRSLLTMRLVDDETFPEIAQQLGYASAETARQAFCEAQAKLTLRLRAQGIRPGGTTVG